MLLDRLYLQILRISSEFGEVIAKGKETTVGAKTFRKRTKKKELKELLVRYHSLSRITTYIYR